MSKMKLLAPTISLALIVFVAGVSSPLNAAEAGLKVHVNQIQRAEQNIGDISFNKMVDFRPLEEVRREMIK